MLLIPISKSGSTAETFASYAFFRAKLQEIFKDKYAQRIIAITGLNDKSLLFKENKDLKENGFLGLLSVPDGIGGRYSVFTPVGMLFAGITGLNLDEFLKGLKTAYEASKQPLENGNNIPYELARIMYLLDKNRHLNMVTFMPYDNALEGFSRWYRQLHAESLGKTVEEHVYVDSEDKMVARIYFTYNQDKSDFKVFKVYDGENKDLGVIGLSKGESTELVFDNGIILTITRDDKNKKDAVSLKVNGNPAEYRVSKVNTYTESTTPLALVGTRDNHSSWQLINNGPKDKLVIFTKVNSHNPDYKIETSGTAGLEYLQGRYIGKDMLTASQIGTETDAKNNSIPNVTFEIEGKTEAVLAEYMYTLMMTIAVLGELYDINAFNQYSVEGYKLETKAALKKLDGGIEDKKEVGAAVNTHTSSVGIVFENKFTKFDNYIYMPELNKLNETEREALLTYIARQLYTGFNMIVADRIIIDAPEDVFEAIKNKFDSMFNFQVKPNGEADLLKRATGLSLDMYGRKLEIVCASSVTEPREFVKQTLLTPEVPESEARIIVIDLGGTGLKGGALKGTELVASSVQPWKPGDFKNPERHVKIIESVIEALAQKARFGHINAVGISWASPLVEEKIRLQAAIGFGITRDQFVTTIMPIKDRLEKDLGVPVAILNDGEAAGYRLAAEAKANGEDVKNTLFLIMGTALASAYFNEEEKLDINILHELGNIVIDNSPDAAKHGFTGIAGAAQQYVSQAGLVRAAEQMGIVFPATVPGTEKARFVGMLLDAPDQIVKEYGLKEDAKELQAKSLAAHRLVGQYIAALVEEIARVYDVKKVKISGGVTLGGSGDIFVEEAKNILKDKIAISRASKDRKVVRMAGATGAGYYAYAKTKAENRIAKYTLKPTYTPKIAIMADLYQVMIETPKFESEPQTIKDSPVYGEMLVLLERGIKIGLVTANDAEDAVRAIVAYIPKELLPNLTIYANGYSQMITFDAEGNRWTATYGKAISKTDREIIEKAAREEIDVYVAEAQANLAALKAQYPDFEFERKGSFIIPEIRVRGELADKSVTQIGIVGFATKKHARGTIAKYEDDLRGKAFKNLLAKLPEDIKRHYNLRVAGETSIDVNGGVNKALTMDNFLATTRIFPEELIYIGKNFSAEGDDAYVVGAVSNVHYIAVDADQSAVISAEGVVKAGSGMAATKKVFQSLVANYYALATQDKTNAVIYVAKWSLDGGEKKKLFSSKEIAPIVEKVGRYPARSVILLGGPSSTGKATFTRYLKEAIEKQYGREVKVLELDRYFKPIVERPVDENNSPEFDHPECLYLNRIAEDLNKLCCGEKVDLAKYDMKTRTFVPRTGTKLQLSEGDILAIDSIHALNKNIVSSLSDIQLVKVYLYAPEEIRLMRRILRDIDERGETVESVLSVWPRVRSREIEFIEPLKDTVDYILNAYTPEDFILLRDRIEPLLAAASVSLEALNDDSKQVLAGLRKAFEVPGKDGGETKVLYILNSEHGAGKSSFARVLAEKTGLDIFSGGAIKRGMAKDRGMSIEEFNEYLKGNSAEDKKVNDAIDQAQIEGLKEGNRIFESSFSSYLVRQVEEELRNKGTKIVRVLIRADSRIRAERVARGNREGDKGGSVEGIKKDLEERDEFDRQQFLRMTNGTFDIFSEKNYDMVIDTSKTTLADVPEQVRRMIDYAYRVYNSGIITKESFSAEKEAVKTGNLAEVVKGLKDLQKGAEAEALEYTINKLWDMPARKIQRFDTASEFIKNGDIESAKNQLSGVPGFRVKFRIVANAGAYSWQEDNGEEAVIAIDLELLKNRALTEMELAGGIYQAEIDREKARAPPAKKLIELVMSFQKAQYFYNELSTYDQARVIDQLMKTDKDTGGFARTLITGHSSNTKFNNLLQLIEADLQDKSGKFALDEAKINELKQYKENGFQERSALEQKELVFGKDTVRVLNYYVFTLLKQRAETIGEDEGKTYVSTYVNSDYLRNYLEMRGILAGNDQRLVNNLLKESEATGRPLEEIIGGIVKSDYLVKAPYDKLPGYGRELLAALYVYIGGAGVRATDFAQKIMRRYINNPKYKDFVNLVLIAICSISDEGGHIRKLEDAILRSAAFWWYAIPNGDITVYPVKMALDDLKKEIMTERRITSYSCEIAVWENIFDVMKDPNRFAPSSYPQDLYFFIANNLTMARKIDQTWIKTGITTVDKASWQNLFYVMARLITRQVEKDSYEAKTDKSMRQVYEMTAGKSGYAVPSSYQPSPQAVILEGFAVGVQQQKGKDKVTQYVTIARDEQGRYFALPSLTEGIIRPRKVIKNQESIHLDQVAKTFPRFGKNLEIRLAGKDCIAVKIEGKEFIFSTDDNYRTKVAGVGELWADTFWAELPVNLGDNLKFVAKSQLVEGQDKITDAAEYHPAVIHQGIMQDLVRDQQGHVQYADIDASHQNEFNSVFGRKDDRQYQPRTEYAAAAPDAIEALRKVTGAVVMGDTSIITSMVAALQVKGLTEEIIALEGKVLRVYVFKIMQDIESAGLDIFEQIKLFDRTLAGTVNPGFKFDHRFVDVLILPDIQALPKEMQEEQKKNFDKALEKYNSEEMQEKFRNGEAKRSKEIPEEPLHVASKEKVEEYFLGLGIKVVWSKDLVLNKAKFTYNPDKLWDKIEDLRSDFEEKKEEKNATGQQDGGDEKGRANSASEVNDWENLLKEMIASFEEDYSRSVEVSIKVAEDMAKSGSDPAGIYMSLTMGDPAFSSVMSSFKSILGLTQEYICTKNKLESILSATEFKTEIEEFEKMLEEAIGEIKALKLPSQWWNMNMSDKVAKNLTTLSNVLNKGFERLKAKLDKNNSQETNKQDGGEENREIEYVLAKRKEMLALAEAEDIVFLENIILEQDRKSDAEKDWYLLAEAVAARNLIGDSENEYLRNKYQSNLFWLPANKGRRDLHLHTSLSDGTEKLDNFVRQAVKSVIKVMAVTDHNSIIGVKRAVELGKKYGIVIVPGCECTAFMTVDREQKIFITGHILAYGIDVDNLKLKALIRDVQIKSQLAWYADLTQAFEMLQENERLEEILKQGAKSLPEDSIVQNMLASLLENPTVQNMLTKVIGVQNKESVRIYRDNGLEKEAQKLERTVQGITLAQIVEFERLLKDILQTRQAYELNDNEKELLEKLFWQCSQPTPGQRDFNYMLLKAAYEDTVQSKPEIEAWGWLNLRVPGTPILSSAHEVISAIHAAGGIAVLAHPKWYPEVVFPAGKFQVDNDKLWYKELTIEGLSPAQTDNFRLTCQIVDDICTQGIDGIEIYTYWLEYAKQRPFEEIVDQHNLFRTWGSDAHGRLDRVKESLGLNQAFYMPDAALKIFHQAVVTAGCVGTDIDDTMLDEVCHTLNDSPCMSPVLGLLERGFTVAAITNNKTERFLEKILPHISRDLRKNLLVYSFGGRTKARFSDDGEPVFDEEYLQDKVMDEETFTVIEKRISPIIKKAQWRVHNRHSLRRHYPKFYSGPEERFSRDVSLIVDRDEFSKAILGLFIKYLPSAHYNNGNSVSLDLRQEVLRSIERVT
ncbi:MAG: ROK family protein, partial [Candidatus Omnitrophica bacterium]|nr:ROK family protein [Candidatus Omnitrophota bacterium]